MPSANFSEVRTASSQLVVAGAATDGRLSATRFLPAMGGQRLSLPIGRAPVAVRGIGLFAQLVAPMWMDNQIHDEHLIPEGEQY
jgi:hypothetical protein